MTNVLVDSSSTVGSSCCLVSAGRVTLNNLRELVVDGPRFPDDLGRLAYGGLEDA